MKSSERKIAANQENGRKSLGPHNTERTSQNATKHAYYARGLTPLDDVDAYENELQAMTQEFEPFGVVEKGILERMALYQIRLKRAASFEAQDLASRIRPRKREREVQASSKFDGLDLELEVPTIVVLEVVEHLMTHHKCTTWLTNNYYRELHELERLRRMRKGDHVPAPMSVDVNVHADRRGHRSTPGVRIPPNDVTDPRWPAVTIEAVNVGDENDSSSADTEVKTQSPADAPDTTPVAEVNREVKKKEPPKWSPNLASKQLWDKS